MSQISQSKYKKNKIFIKKEIFYKNTKLTAKLFQIVDYYLLKFRLGRLLPPIILHRLSKCLRFQAVEKAVDGWRTSQ